MVCWLNQMKHILVKVNTQTIIFGIAKLQQVLYLFDYKLILLNGATVKQQLTKIKGQYNFRQLF